MPVFYLLFLLAYALTAPITFLTGLVTGQLLRSMLSND
jgi:hypothetical protein